MESTPRTPPRSPALYRAAFPALLLLAACGHPATAGECEEIFAHSAEIELKAQNITDPKLIADRTAAVRAARGDELIQQCVGKRITSSALECVRQAETALAVDKCLE